MNNVGLFDFHINALKEGTNMHKVNYTKNHFNARPKLN